MHTPSIDPSETPGHEVDASRRLIFITDLDSSSAGALMETTSYNQASAVRDALYKHIAGEASIGVKIPVSPVAGGYFIPLQGSSLSDAIDKRVLEIRDIISSAFLRLEECGHLSGR